MGVRALMPNFLLQLFVLRSNGWSPTLLFLLRVLLGRLRPPPSLSRFRRFARARRRHLPTIQNTFRCPPATPAALGTTLKGTIWLNRHATCRSMDSISSPWQKSASSRARVFGMAE